MWKMNSAFIALVFVSFPAFAGIPFAKLNFDQHERFEDARQVLEEQIGAPLSAQQQIELAALIQKERPESLVMVGNQAPTKAIYCVGLTMSLGTSMTRAACVHIWSAKGYSLMIVGVGGAIQIQGQVFRLKVTFDPSRYDNNFDPVPGKYGVGSMGVTVLGGATTLQGDSGNKRVTAFGLNIGLGVDAGTISMLVIE